MNLRSRSSLVVSLLLACGVTAAACGSGGGAGPTATVPATSTPPTTATAGTTAASATTGEPATTAEPTATSTPATTAAIEPVTITMLTYDAFEAPDSLKQFTAATGITVKLAQGGDAGLLVNKAILTKGNPEGDVLWGLDNTLLSRAVAEKGLFVPYTAVDLAALDPAATALVPGHDVTPVDTGDVCLNYDKAWFADHQVAPPATLDDLVKPAYKDLVVVENPATSSPGLAFLLASVSHFGESGYLGWWTELRTNGVRVVDDWDTAYYNEFTQGGSGGKRPIVVSYASSPPATIVFATDPKPTEATTASVDASCFRQVEFAGILAGSKHVEAAQKLIDFLVSAQFQSELPLTNFVYPVRTGVALPDVFVQWGKPSPKPFSLDPAVIAAKRDGWVDAWTKVVVR